MKTMSAASVVAPHTVWRALRPEQWIKNLVVAAPFFFALGDRMQAVSAGLLLRAVYATLLFCCISSGVYLFNDLMDMEADRLHPNKRNRPVASGLLPPRPAWTLAAVLMLFGLAMGWWISLMLAFYMSLYLLLQFAYSLWFKYVTLLDIMVIAAGFVLRALAGAAAVDIPISPWLVLCTFMLALFLGVCKRRHEKVQSAGAGARSSLTGYRRDALDRMAVTIAVAVVLSYLGYVLAPETAHKFGDRRLLATLPFVVFGVRRYLILVMRRNMGDRPERILLTDIPMLLNLVLYGGAVLGLTLLVP